MSAAFQDTVFPYVSTSFTAVVPNCPVHNIMLSNINNHEASDECLCSLRIRIQIDIEVCLADFIQQPKFGLRIEVPC